MWYSQGPVLCQYFGARLFPADLCLDKCGARYEQLARALKGAILDGRMPSGARLPSTRALAARLGLSRNTILSAYEMLRAEQLITIHDRSGARVSEAVRLMGKRSSRVSAPAQSRYAARTRRLGPNPLASRVGALRYDLRFGRSLSDPRVLQAWRRRLSAAALAVGREYPDPIGFPPLRRAISDHLARRRDVTCTEDDIVIVAGTQQAMTLAARVVLDEGDVAAIVEPFYPFAMRTFKAHGAKIATVRVDTNGMMSSTLEKRHARIICVSPSHQFPSGSELSLERRIDLLQFAENHNSWILEDDYDNEFHYGRRPIATLRSLDFSGRVIYVGSFSKTLFPSLRLGYIVCPSGLRDDFRTAKLLDDLGCPIIEQAALAAFMQSQQFDRYLHRTKRELERRRHKLIECLQRFAGERIRIDNSPTGAHVVVWLRDISYRQLDKLIQLGLERGLGFNPIRSHYRRRPSQPGLLLGIAGLSMELIEPASVLFVRCLDDLATKRDGRT